MAIVKMKRLRLLGMRADRERMLGMLQRLGCVEVDELDLDRSIPEWAALTRPDGRHWPQPEMSGICWAARCPA